MSTTGGSASNNGDKLLIDNVAPAFPQSVERLSVAGTNKILVGLGEGDLLIREGFQVAGATASENV